MPQVALPCSAPPSVRASMVMVKVLNVPSHGWSLQVRLVKLKGPVLTRVYPSGMRLCLLALFFRSLHLRK